MSRQDSLGSVVSTIVLCFMCPPLLCVVVPVALADAKEEFVSALSAPRTGSPDRYTQVLGWIIIGIGVAFLAIAIVLGCVLCFRG